MILSLQGLHKMNSAESSRGDWVSIRQVTPRCTQRHHTVHVPYCETWLLLGCLVKDNDKLLSMHENGCWAPMRMFLILTLSELSSGLIILHSFKLLFIHFPALRFWSILRTKGMQCNQGKRLRQKAWKMEWSNLEQIRNRNDTISLHPMKFKHVSIYALQQTSMRQKIMNNGDKLEEACRDADVPMASISNFQTWIIYTTSQRTQKAQHI